jgi:hypothetical protein
MKKFLKIIAIFISLIALTVITIVLLTPWMDRWGATEAEIAATFPGDELVPAPASFVNHAITIQASPEKIYPWLLQMGGGKGGLYSYTAFETLIGCPLVNADRIHEESQDLKIGDEVKMCPNTNIGQRCNFGRGEVSAPNSVDPENVPMLIGNLVGRNENGKGYAYSQRQASRCAKRKMRWRKTSRVFIVKLAPKNFMVVPAKVVQNSIPACVRKY